ncbi:MAG: DUF169 domain-containing protein [Chlorobium sp.]|uniref:hypothetical protein n=1 Tax=Chlorobium sp. TaxID=1095 RepID=UPI0025BB9837|nr:hypothetical protein [Chlorobium sp.]MCF8382461.1 DUF169 domain-containing protein [Chlorobium sp.]
MTGARKTFGCHGGIEQFLSTGNPDFCHTQRNHPVTSFPKNLLTFAVPYRMYLEMESNEEERFLEKHKI